MSNNEDYPLFYKIAWGYCILIIVIVVCNFSEEIFVPVCIVAFLIICVSYILAFEKKIEFSKECKMREQNFKKEVTSINYQHQKKIEELETRLNKEELRCQDLKLCLKSSIPFSLTASLYSDLIASIYQTEIDYLQHKKHPAYSAAEVVSKLKEKARMHECQYKEMLYKYETLISLFPELEKYVDDVNYIKEGNIAGSLDEVRMNYDRVQDWLTPGEYKTLSVEERNQRALDLYLKRKKTPKEIGDDYEMYIGWRLKQMGYETFMFGLKRGLQDLGRDIIAFWEKDDSKHEVLIIQCKRWSQNKEIHENVICQLYGTTVQFILSNKDLLQNHINVKPVIVTTTPLSRTAQEFAEYLKVLVKIVPMGEYPRIKCNVNNGSKIYHLPFDQQYKNAEIKNAGEFYAFTVKEAMDKGFRRACRWYG